MIFPGKGRLGHGGIKQGPSLQLLFPAASTAAQSSWDPGGPCAVVESARP